MSVSASLHESLVAARFDALEGRFRAVVEADDVRLDAVARHLGPIDGLRLLDLGCGKGRFARRLAERGARPVGLDASAAMLRAGSGGGLDLVLGSARRLPFVNDSFDGIFAIEILEHIVTNDRWRVLAEAARVLRPGGRLAIVDKNAASLDPVRPWLPAVVVKRIDERRGRWMYPPGSAVRERWFWPGEVRRMLRRAGLVDLRSEPLLSPAEAGHRAFRLVPMARRFVVWSGRKAGGGDRAD